DDLVTGVQTCALPIYRIETATFAIAAAVTDGEITIRGARPDHLHAVLDKLREAGVKVDRNGLSMTVSRGKQLNPVDITTLPYARSEERRVGKEARRRW